MMKRIIAGEHGKGFSMVVTETGKLAEQSKQSSEEISASIQQQSASAEEVAALANNLSEIVDAMKISVTKFTI
jgi:methyl-accepting chemotaxis protein